MYGYRQPSAVILVSSDSALLYLHLTAKVRKIKQSKAEACINPISGKVNPILRTLVSYVMILLSHIL